MTAIGGLGLTALRSLAVCGLLLGPLACKDEPGVAASAQAELAPRTRLDEVEARSLLRALSGPSAADAASAISRIREAHDTRFISAFIELMRASETRIAAPAVFAASVEALEELSGEQIGASWPGWVEWYAGTELEAPPGFTAWKGDLLGRVEPHFAQLLYEGAPSRIRVEEVVWGGVPYEGIPPLEHPATLSAKEASYLQPGEPVFGIVLGGEARAYPLRILDWHEMTNDRLGGVAFSLTYCTLCGAGIAYRSIASDGVAYDFGSSGLLMRSNKLMVDRQTRSLWNQFTGRPVLGRLADSTVELERLPAVVATWEDWRVRHPDTSVLSLETGFERNYAPGAAYGGYFASDETMFPVRSTPSLLDRKQRIYGLELGGVAKAYPLDELIHERVVNDELGGWPLVLIAARKDIRVSGVSERSGPARYSAGASVRAYSSDRLLPFGLDEAGELVGFRGMRWRVTEEALIGPGGERAPRVAGVLSYWFAWSAYHPTSLVYGSPGP
jgi:hypothetical protein